MSGVVVMVCEKIQNQTRQGFLLKVVKVDGFSQARKAETEAEAGSYLCEKFTSLKYQIPKTIVIKKIIFS